jgi:hypothetical protein
MVAAKFEALRVEESIREVRFDARREALVERGAENRRWRVIIKNDKFVGRPGAAEYLRRKTYVGL